MDTLKIEYSSDELESASAPKSASAPNENREDVTYASNFLIVDLDDEDEGSYECCRVC